MLLLVLGGFLLSVELFVIKLWIEFGVEWFDDVILGEVCELIFVVKLMVGKVWVF